MFHGTDDELVLHHWGKLSFDKLKNIGSMTAKFVSVHRVGHGVNDQEMRQIIEWISRKLPKLDQKL